MFFFFFFNDTATTEIYTLSLHDALPILMLHKMFVFQPGFSVVAAAGLVVMLSIAAWLSHAGPNSFELTRSEEHTSELQSQSNLVCRLLLVKKNININTRIASARYIIDLL